MSSPRAIRDDPPGTSSQYVFSYPLLVSRVLLYFHNFNIRLNFFFPFQSNYIEMIKLKIEASVQKQRKNKIGRED